MALPRRGPFVAVAARRAHVAGFLLIFAALVCRLRMSIALPVQKGRVTEI